LLVENSKIIKVKFNEIRNWQLQSQNENQLDGNGFVNYPKQNFKYKDIHLTFENEFDKDEESGLLAFIYQEYFIQENNRFVCFNIEKLLIETSVIVNP